MKAMIVLENGNCYEGLSIGVPGEIIGDVVLNTSVVGYQEMMTDPANAGKILVLTYPLIGNYGVASKFNESKKCWLAGLAIKEASRIYSNYQAEGSLTDFLKKESIVTANDIDTRTLAVDVRDNGEMPGIISTKSANKSDLLAKLKDKSVKNKKDFIKNISVKSPTEIKSGASGPQIAVLDIGMLNSFMRQLKTLGCNLTLLPYDTSSEEILKLKPDGIIVSGGPEDDVSLPLITRTVKALLGKMPMLGISTGHQVLALAAGARLKKMKIGHHGVNYPVKGPGSMKGDITVQNHSFVVDEASLKGKKEISVTLKNVNDETVEELESKSLKFIACQYYPSSPGFDEVNQVFRRFIGISAFKGFKNKRTVKSCGEVQYAKA